MSEEKKCLSLIDKDIAVFTITVFRLLTNNCIFIYLCMYTHLFSLDIYIYIVLCDTEYNI